MRCRAGASRRAASAKGVISAPVTECGEADAGLTSTPKTNRSRPRLGTYNVPNAQSQTARQLPKLRLKWAGLVE